MAAVASSFLGQRRVLWFHGKARTLGGAAANHQAGIGKSALLSEFFRFYAMPGDRSGPEMGPGCYARLFSHSTSVSDHSPSEAEVHEALRLTSRLKPRREEGPHSALCSS